MEEEELSLRVWLDRPGRPLDRIECLHIFRQVADSVALAHTQGVVVANARPSCFLVSSFNRVSFIESASCSSDSDGSVSGESDDKRNADDDDRSAAAVVVGDGKKVFPLKQILVLEYEWYTSPEESAGGPATFDSDIYRLGVLLFEIFSTFESLDEKLRSMSNLRHRVLPPSLLVKWPKVASFCLWLLHPKPDTRPKMSYKCWEIRFANNTGKKRKLLLPTTDPITGDLQRTHREQNTHKEDDTGYTWFGQA